MPMTFMRSMIFMLMLPLLSGCALFGRTPMEVLTYKNANGVSPDGRSPQRLLVFMRGLGGSHHSFEKEGLVADVQERGLAFDMVAPNGHFGYYAGRTLIPRLKEDVIDPARAAGYNEIYLIGFSMGGLGSLLYLKEHPQDIQGVCLISPFLGYKSILKEIRSAGGLRQWDPGEFDAEKDWQRMLWQWIKTDLSTDPAKILFLGFGSEDPYTEGQQLLGQILSESRVKKIPGGHTYKTFKTLWHLFLDNRLNPSHHNLTKQ